MSDHLRMPHTCKCARKISDDIAIGKHLSGTHDDYVGTQKVCAAHKMRAETEKIPHGVPPMQVNKVHEGREPAVLRKR